MSWAVVVISGPSSVVIAAVNRGYMLAQLLTDSASAIKCPVCHTRSSALAMPRLAALWTCSVHRLSPLQGTSNSAPVLRAPPSPLIPPTRTGRRNLTISNSGHKAGLAMDGLPLTSHFTQPYSRPGTVRRSCTSTRVYVWSQLRLRRLHIG